MLKLKKMKVLLPNFYIGAEILCEVREIRGAFREIMGILLMESPLKQLTQINMNLARTT